jgi:uncharacterized protein (DUF2267 family)
MYTRHPAGLAVSEADTAFTELVAAVVVSGRYGSGEHAERVTRVVLAELACALAHEERRELARHLPPADAEKLTEREPTEPPLCARQFVTAVGDRIGVDAADIARWHVSSVLGVLAHLVSRELITRMLEQLPRGYALLFGRAELTRAA